MRVTRDPECSLCDYFCQTCLVTSDIGVVDRLGNAAGLDGTSGPIDTDVLLEAITRGDTTRPSDIIPGFRGSLADVTQNPGLASLEYSRQSGQNSGMFTTRRTANNEAVDEVMAILAPE
jgi:hypothetical protein